MSGNGFYNRKTIDVTEVHTNIEQRLIQITEDKLTLILNEHIEFIEQRNSWIAPLGILATLVVVFATTEFKNAYFGSETWKAIFIMSTLFTTGWLVKSIYRAIKAESVIDIIGKIKQGNS